MLARRPFTRTRAVLAGHHELLPGIHALLGMCTEVEVQACHAASDGGKQRALKELLESYERSFKHRGKV